MTGPLYLNLEGKIELQLRSGNAHGHRTCFQCALDAKEAISLATNHSERMKAVARLGGEIRRWHRMLIVEITDIALKNRPTSMTTVANWQRSTFNQSLATSDLKRYGLAGRTAANKLAPIPTNDGISQEARKFFEKHKHRLKARVSPEAFAATHLGSTP